MRSDILKFLNKAYRMLGIECYYIPEDDVYVVTKNHKGVQNFTSRTFYMQPRGFRLNEWRALIKLGLNHNMGERSTVEQIHAKFGQGKKIQLSGN